MIAGLFGAFLIVHGLIHLLGAAKAFRFVDLPQLTPIHPALGVVWLTAGLLFTSAAIGLAVWPRWWWMLGAIGVTSSMIAIVPSWVDARVGAVANLLATTGVITGFLMQGPFSLRAAYDASVDRGLTGRPEVRLVEESDLAQLPLAVQRYLRVSGVVGQPRISGLRARMHGRIRSGPRARWMPFTAEQHNFFDDQRSRLFYMTGTMFGIPFQGFHRYVGPSASMLVKVAGVAKVADASGADMTRAETVTLFNDMCVMAPATLLDASIMWQTLHDGAVRATFTNAGHSISAELQFNDAGELANFWSDDRKASTDGSAMTAMRWSTPLGAYRRFGHVRLASRGQGRWRAAEGEYSYIELGIDEVSYDVWRR
jgi:hypothetical protein